MVNPIPILSSAVSFVMTKAFVWFVNVQHLNICYEATSIKREYYDIIIKRIINLKIMKKTLAIFVLTTMLLSVFSLGVNQVSAHGDGYTDCEKDPVYAKDFTASPTVHLRLRERACMTDSPVITVLSPNSNYQIIAETDGWYKVKLDDGTTGWAGSALMQATSADYANNEKLSDAYEADEKTIEANESLNKEEKQITDRVKGYILLQVESAGEAWYVDPVEEKRFYMKDGPTAYEMMRSFGLGISNGDLEKLLAGDYKLTDRLKGRIVLAVHRNGEAYYIHPKDRSVHYLKNGVEAYRIMRLLSLGITNRDLLKIRAKNVVKNKIAEKKNTAPVEHNGSITLSAEESNGNVYLDWSVDGFNSAKGFKVVISEEPNPVYPGNTYHYHASSEKRADTWTNLASGKTYHFRVCEYLGGECGVYSNDVSVTMSGEIIDNSQGVITLDGEVSSENKVLLNWSLSEMVSPKGFKVVISEDPDPVYPGNTYHYLSNSEVRTDTWSGLNSGTYHFRVCEYLGGKCGVYSNNFQVTIE